MKKSIVLLSAIVITSTMVWKYNGLDMLHYVEKTPPVIECIDCPSVIGTQENTLSLKVTDSGAGISSVYITTSDKTDPATQKELISEFPRTNAAILNVPLHAKTLKTSPQGETLITITATDLSLWKSTHVMEFPIKVDTKSPDIQLLSRFHYGTAGGSLVVHFKDLSDDTETSGVSYGDYFFPGYKTEGDTKIAVVPLVREYSPAERPLYLKATDKAGNSKVLPIPSNVKTKTFSASDMTLSRRFFEQVIAKMSDTLANTFDREVDVTLLSAKSDEEIAELFTLINEKLRLLNEKTIQEVSKNSSETKLWNGAFVKPMSSAMTARFGEDRTYALQGTPAGTSIHFGYDLAHLKNSQVLASNSGKVVYAGPLGIYGNAIIIDHGMGIQTLYGHLARVDVENSQVVSKGETIALSGETGLAGGDHLHFEVRVAGQPVDPKEWLDSHWIETRFQL